MTNFSTERFNYGTFRRKYTNWRFSSIPNHFTDLTDERLELPDFSTLHLCNDFLSNGDTKNIFPDLDSVFIRHERFIKYLSFIASPPSKSSQPFKILKTSFIFRESLYNAQLMKYQTTLTGFKRVYNEDSVKGLKTALLIKDYTKFLQAVFSGGLKHYYKFEFLLRTILNSIVGSNDARHHYIHFPLSNVAYNKPKYLLPMQRIDMGTLRGITDFSFYLELHLLGFIYVQKNHISSIKPLIWDEQEDINTLSCTSLFTRISDDVLDRINLILSVGDKCIIYNLGEIKNIAKTNNLFPLVISHLNKLKGFDVTDEDEPSENEDSILDDDTVTDKDDEFDNRKLPSETVPQEIDDKELKDVIDPDITNRLNYALKRSSAIDSSPVKVSSVTRTRDANKGMVYKTTPKESELLKRNLDIREDDLPFLTHDANELTDEINDNLVDIDTSLKPVIAPKPSQEKKPEIKISSQYPKVGYLDEMEKNINVALAKVPDVTPTDVERVKKLVQIHLSSKINGMEIGDLVTAPTYNTESRDLSYLDDKVEDKTILKSKINDYDQQYVKKMQSADLAKTLSSFTKQGYFIQNIKETPIHTDFDRKTEYNIKLVDIKGKPHSINFTLPEVNENGELYANGIKFRMVKQQVNLPICKVSDYRVNLASNYNKTILERTRSVNNAFESYIDSYILDLFNQKLIDVVFGEEYLPSQLILPFEYATIRQKYQQISFDKYRFIFYYNHRFDNVVNVDQVKKFEGKYGVYVGNTTGNEYLFWANDDVITILSQDGSSSHTTHFISILNMLYGDKCSLPDICREYTELKILDKVFPTILVLGYEYGLKDIFTTLDLKYNFIPKGKRIKRDSIYDIVIPFSDGHLIFNRYPLSKSLVMSGLCKLPTKTVTFDEMDDQDTYYRLLMQKGISINYLKGIQAFFDFFIDPITEEILQNMGEPTELKQLLIRATELVSTKEFYQSSSLRHHRIRGYERFSDILYNEVARSMAAYNNNVNPAKKFSINPEAVFQKIISDNTIQNLDIINPIHELKYKTQVTFTGTGGRTARSFVANDRKYPEDGVGILSEATPDSSKVALTAYTSANPRITNLRGMYEYNEDNRDKRSTSETFSITGNLMPGLTQDDGKRVSFTNIQLSHHVPCDEGEVCRVRTEYEQVIPHLVSDTFCITAKHNGVITKIDDKKSLLSIDYDDIIIPTKGKIAFPYRIDTTIQEDNKLVYFFTSTKEASKFNVGDIYTVDKNTNFVITTIAHVDENELTLKDDITNYRKVSRKYNGDKLSYVVGYMTSPVMDGGTEVYSFGDQYTATAGDVLRQSYTVNVREKDHVSRGDVLIYNKGFFIADPYTRQVSWKHGVTANIALIDMPETEEDGCSISKSFSEKMKMDTAHVRDIIIDNHTVISNMVNVGDHVNVADKLCDLLEDSINTLVDEEDDDTINFLSELGTSSPKAKYSGTVESIKLYYCCDPSELNESLANLAKKLYAKEKNISVEYKGAKNESNIKYVYSVPKNLKYKSIEFVEGTVLIEVIISKKIVTAQGDKLCILNSNKTITSNVMEKAPYLDDGTEIDILFSTTSISNRIVWSPYLVGHLNLILQKAERDICDMYFDKK